MRVAPTARNMGLVVSEGVLLQEESHSEQTRQTLQDLGWAVTLNVAS